MNPMLPSPLKGTVPVFTTCPHCSVLKDGNCFTCSESDAGHPACVDCRGGIYYPPPRPWYENDVLVAIATATVVSVTSALLIAAIQGYVTKDR